MDTTDQKFNDIGIGSAEEFSKVFYQYYPVLVTFSNLYLPDKSSCEDLVQDFFIHLWDNSEKINVRSNLKNYLFVSVKHRCLDQLKKKNMTVSLEDTDETALLDTGDTAPFEQKESAERVKSILHRLSPQCRMVFILVRFEGFSYKEASEILDLRVKTIENHMGRALKALREINDTAGPLLSGKALFLLFLFPFDNQLYTGFFESGLGVFTP